MSNPEADWPEAMATVLECHFDARAGRALAFGAPSGKRFRIRYNYFAGGQTHEGELFSARAMAQNTLFPVRYNPDNTRDHNHRYGTADRSRAPLIVFGVVGSVVLSLVWLLILRGCGPAQ